MFPVARKQAHYLKKKLHETFEDKLSRQSSLAWTSNKILSVPEVYRYWHQDRKGLYGQLVENLPRFLRDSDEKSYQQVLKILNLGAETFSPYQVLWLFSDLFFFSHKFSNWKTRVHLYLIYMCTSCLVLSLHGTGARCSPCVLEVMGLELTRSSRDFFFVFFFLNSPTIYFPGLKVVRQNFRVHVKNPEAMGNCKRTGSYGHCLNKIPRKNLPWKLLLALGVLCCPHNTPVLKW